MGNSMPHQLRAPGEAVAATCTHVYIRTHAPAGPRGSFGYTLGAGTAGTHTHAPPHTLCTVRATRTRLRALEVVRVHLGRALQARERGREVRKRLARARGRPDEHVEARRHCGGGAALDLCGHRGSQATVRTREQRVGPAPLGGRRGAGAPGGQGGGRPSRKHSQDERTAASATQAHRRACGNAMGRKCRGSICMWLPRAAHARPRQCAGPPAAPHPLGTCSPGAPRGR